MEVIEANKDSKWTIRYRSTHIGAEFLTGHYWDNKNINIDYRECENIIAHAKLKRLPNARGYREVNQTWYEVGTPFREVQFHPEWSLPVHSMIMHGQGMIELLKAIEVGAIKVVNDEWEGLWTFKKIGQVVSLAAYLPKLKSSHL